MATLSHSDSKRKYSWWWDSHISPKNSKWLQENLTDMDSKVKQMIKLIEEDADSFARRAEMYYKKRPELMKLVEEFYRAYRALAERYDHATVVLHHAHRTMAEAFPNQDPPVFCDDLQAGSFSSESVPRTPDMSPPPRAFIDHDELHEDIVGLPPSNFHAVKGNGVSNEESNSLSGRRGVNEILTPGKPESHANFRQRGARKALNFQDLAEKESIVPKDRNLDDKAVVLSETERVRKAEMEILALKEALAKLQDEKDAGLTQYQQSLERVSKLESELIHAQENSRGLNECASKAEAEVQTLKEALTKIEGERESCLLQYKQWMEKVSDLERKILSSQKDAGELKDRSTRAESEAESLKHELSRTKTEKEAALRQYKECQDKVSDLEEKLLKSEEDCRRLVDRANEAEKHIVLMKEEIAKLLEQKEVAASQYQQWFVKISSLEHKLSCAEEEARMLICEVDSGLKKLKGSEERCLVLEKSNKDLQLELESLVQKVRLRNEELTEKQKEMGRLWTCIQEERLRFVEAETAFQTLQSIYSKSQEELRVLAMELHNKAKVLDDMDTQNQILNVELHRCKEENDILNDLKLSSALSIEKLEDEILNLRETIRKLEEDVELRVDQRNALQQEIYCLKEELNNLNKKHQDMLQQVESVGYDPNRFASSVKELQNNNSNLKKRCEVQEVEKAALLKKLEVMEKLLEKNAVLENSLSYLNVELETVRGRVKMLEGSYKYLMEEKCSLIAEKATLTSQLQVTLENLEKLSQKNNLLENSLFDVNVELHGFREKAKSLEDSLFVLKEEKSSLISEKETLFSQLGLTHHSLENLVKRCSELEEKHLTSKSEKESALQKIEQLLVSLYAEREEHSKSMQSSEIQLADKDMQIHLLQADGRRRQENYEEQLDRTVNAEMEIFILQKCVQDLEGKSISLLIEHQKLLETAEMSEKLISKLKKESIQNQDEIQSLYEKIKMLRLGLYQVLKTLDISKEILCENVITEDHMLLYHIHHHLQETQNSLIRLCHENQQMNIEKSVLITALEQLKLEIDDLLIERNTIDVNFRIQTRQFLALREESQTVSQKNEELRSRIEESNKRIEILETDLDDTLRQLSMFEVANKSLQEESHKAFEEKTVFSTKVLHLGEEKRKLESEVFSMLGEIISETTISQIYKSILFECISAIRELTKNMGKISSTNKELEEKLKIMAEKLEDVEMHNSNLQESLEKSHIELLSVESANYHLKSEKEKEKEVLLQKEDELLQEKEMFIVLQNEKTELQDIVKDLKMKYHEARVILEDQETRIAQLSSDKEYLNGELGGIFAVSKKLKSEMMDLCCELSRSKSREELLSYELQKEKTEVDFWETEVAGFYGDLQLSAIKELLFEAKIRELVEECEILEHRSYSQKSEIKLLKDRVSCLESDNGRLHEHLAAFIPAVASLKDGITSLEKQTLYQTAQHNVHDRQTKEDIENQLHAESCQQKDVNQRTIVADPLSEFQILQKRINAVEKAVMHLKAVSVPKHLTDDVEVGGTREIRELKIRTSSRRENNEAREPRDGRTTGHRWLNSSRKNSDLEAEVLTKDIILDQMSESSSYGKSRRGIMLPDDQMIELWEITDQDENIDLTVGNVPKKGSKPVNQPQKHNKNPSAESLVKELRVDKLEISKKIGEPRERKILERLDSDVQKLTNLQITVEDLKKKIEMNAKAKRGTDIQYETLMGQLEIAEASITKLSGINRKLMKHAEDGSLSVDGDTTAGSDESGSISKRGRLSAQARRASEKIGRLQVEVKRMQFVLLKLDGEKESKGKTKVLERSPRVLLRDYLYGSGGARAKHQRRRRAKFCACVQPSTKSD